MELSGVREERQRFFDGGDTSTPYDEGAPPRIILDREPSTPPQRFLLRRRIGYRDRWLGDLLVPADTARFETDLTTVPALFTWLVPKDGTHLLAALVHDGLFGAPGSPASYVSVDGHDVERVQANRVFRDAMADGGTRVVRRWLMWAAVTLATMLLGHGTRWSAAARWRYRLAAGGTVLVIALLGLAATLDLFDGPGPGVPWMPEGPWPVELFTGLAGAVAIPFLLGLTWGSFWKAGVIVGIGMAVLLQVSAVIVALTGLYRAVEWVATRWPMVAAVVAAVVMAVAAVTVVVSLG
ncbi:MAG: DUF1353 domain-containing protein [Nocardioides sp.]